MLRSHQTRLRSIPSTATPKIAPKARNPLFAPSGKVDYANRLGSRAINSLAISRGRENGGPIEAKEIEIEHLARTKLLGYLNDLNIEALDLLPQLEAQVENRDFFHSTTHTRTRTDIPLSQAPLTIFSIFPR